MSPDERAARLKAIARYSPDHPALSWQSNGTLLAHGRADATHTRCGRAGDLSVCTDSLVPRCPACYRT